MYFFLLLLLSVLIRVLSRLPTGPSGMQGAHPPLLVTGIYRTQVEISITRPLSIVDPCCFVAPKPRSRRKTCGDRALNLPRLSHGTSSRAKDIYPLACSLGSIMVFGSSNCICAPRVRLELLSTYVCCFLGLHCYETDESNFVRIAFVRRCFGIFRRPLSVCWGSVHGCAGILLRSTWRMYQHFLEQDQ